MRTKRFITAVVVLIMAAFLGLSFAQEAEKKVVKERFGMLSTLTEDQQKQIKDLRTQIEKEILPLKSDLQVKSAELKQLLVAEKPDRAAINKKIDEIGSLRTQIQKKKVENQLKVRVLLTPEQRIMFDKRILAGRKQFRNRNFPMMGKRLNRMRKFRGRRSSLPPFPPEKVTK